MKYERLADAELEKLEKEFIQFLAANSISADDWEKLKKEQNDKALEIVDMFSDLVWDKALENIKFVEQRSTSEIRVYHFDKEEAEVLVLKVESGVDFTKPEDVKSIATGKTNLADHNPQVFRGKKAYSKELKTELYETMKLGARPCHEAFWRSFVKLADQS